MTVYKTTGVLTGNGIETDNVGQAQEYLTSDNMTQYVDDDLKKVVEFVEWRLDSNGVDYHVLVVTNRDLTDEESSRMSDWISGQNSDGLGEGFEQQDWAWVEDEDCEDCDPVMGIGCGACGSMASFDWKDNKSILVKQEANR